MSTPSKKTVAKASARRNAAALAGHAARESVLFNYEPSPFHATLATGAAKLVVVTGENASGKSLYVRVIAAIAQQDGLTAVSVSIRERTGAGSSDIGGLRRVMMFGDEQDQSTGATSVTVTSTAFGNLDRKDGSLLILDEPEIGLSEAYARALGEFVGQQALQIPAACRGVIVVTHSRPLVSGLLDGFAKKPTHVALSADAPVPAGIDRWLTAPEHHTVQELLGLRDVGLDRYRQVRRILAG